MADHRAAFWAELGEVLDRGFTGQIILHCAQGQVARYEVHETKKPRNGNERAELEIKTRW